MIIEVDFNSDEAIYIHHVGEHGECYRHEHV